MAYHKHIAHIVIPDALHFANTKDKIRVFNKPIYEIIYDQEKYPNINLRKFGVWTHNFNEIAAFKDAGHVFNDSYEFLLKTNYISHYFIGDDPASGLPLAKVYGHNYLQWRPDEAIIEMHECRSAPFNTEPKVFETHDHYKGTALISIALACAYYVKFNPVISDTRTAITLHATHYAYSRNIYGRYGFRLEEYFAAWLAELNEVPQEGFLYPMYMTGGSVLDFISEHKNIFAGQQHPFQ